MCIRDRYTFPLAGWDAHVQGDVLYQSRFNVALRTNDPFPAGSNDVAILGGISGYATADFSVGVEHEKTSVELFVKNAFDSRGQVNRYTACTIGICAATYAGIPTTVYAVPIQPMTVGLKVGQKF